MNERYKNRLINVGTGLDVDQLAQIIREVDGNHSLGAGVLAERIVERVAALAEPKAGAVPDGWQLVPVEPDQGMISIGFDTMRTDNVRDSSEQGRVKRIYRAMLAAAPQAKPGDTSIPDMRDAIPESFVVPQAEPEERGCGACGDGCDSRPAGCEVADLSPPAEQQGQAVTCQWPDCGHDTNRVGYSPGCSGKFCPKPVSGSQMADPDPYGATETEVLTHFLAVCRESKPVGQWPSERVCQAIDRLLNPGPRDFIATADMSPLRGHNGRGGDADPTLSGPRRPQPAAVDAVRVDDAMVRRAVHAYDGWVAEHAGGHGDAFYDGMQAALEAALSAQGREGEAG